MRIVAGEYKGRTIESPSGRTTRPTTDRVRESIFSSIYSRIDDLSQVTVLDAFAGSGALGIEAISRGARMCTFFEQDTSARRVLEKNTSSLGLDPSVAKVIGQDVFAAAKKDVPGEPFGLVLLDPPYAYEPTAIEGLLDELAERGGLEEGCVVVYEHDLKNKGRVQETFEADDRFCITSQKKYGKIGVTYLQYRTSEDQDA